MDISNHTTNIHPYGTNNGMKSASFRANDASVVSVSKPDGQLTPNKVDASNQTRSTSEVASDKSEKHVSLSKVDREKMVEQMNKFVSNINRGVSFRVDKDSGQDVTTVYETKSGDVIRQYPDEDMLEIFRRLAHHSDKHSGLLSEKV